MNEINCKIVNQFNGKLLMTNSENCTKGIYIIYLYDIDKHQSNNYFNC